MYYIIDNKESWYFMKLSEILSNYINEHNISIREFARRTGLSNSYIANIVNGSNNNPTLEAVAKIAQALGIPKKNLFDALDEDQMFFIKSTIPIAKIPLYSSISCGTGIFVDDSIEDYITVPERYLKKGTEYFANTATGDSMIGKGIKNGDILVFEKTSILESGQIGSFCIGESEAVCKTLRKLPNGMIMLESANDAYDPIVVDLSNECFRVIGKYKFKFSIEQ